MSHITDMVLLTTLPEDEATARLQGWCAENDRERGQQFAKLDTDAAGGVKVFTDHVWAMAGNYFPAERLAEALPSFGWHLPEGVVLTIRQDGWAGIHVVTGDGRTIARDPELW